MFASHHNLSNLIIIIDVNSLIILGKTEDCLKLSPIDEKLSGYNFKIQNCDGHNVEELEKCFNLKSDRTKIIVASTIKGKGFSLMENKAQWHYWNNINDDEIQKCRDELK